MIVETLRELLGVAERRLGELEHKKVLLDEAGDGFTLPHLDELETADLRLWIRATRRLLSTFGERAHER